MEEKAQRKKILWYFLGAGVLVATVLLYQSVHCGVLASVRTHHIQYSFDGFSPMVKSLSLVYLIPCVLPFFISSQKHIRILGVLFLVAFAISKIFYQGFVFSIWCYFLAC
jgi:hypothetical protein